MKDPATPLASAIAAWSFKRCRAKEQALISKKRRLTALFMVASTLAGCGGDGEPDWLFPLWVPTDILVAVFAPAQTYVFGIYPWKMALGDIDGDGAADLVVTDFGNSASTAPLKSVWMLLQDTDDRGTFLAAQRLPLDPNDPYDVAIGDLSGDDVPDIVLADPPDGQSGATLLVQDPDNRGTFFAPFTIPLPGRTGHVVLGDIDGNGRDDLAFRVLMSITNYVRTTQLGIVYQQPGGVLAPAAMLPQSQQTGENTQMLELADYDRNGTTDVVEFFTPADQNYQTKVTTLLQNPVGSFTPVTTSLAGVQGVDDGVTADLDGDGRPDFASVGFYPVGTPTTVYSGLNVFIQDGSGGFSQTAAISMPVSCSRLAAGDVDGDGYVDLVALGGENEIVLVRQSKSAPGTFLVPKIVD